MVEKEDKSSESGDEQSTATTVSVKDEEKSETKTSEPRKATKTVNFDGIPDEKDDEHENDVKDKRKMRFNSVPVNKSPKMMQLNVSSILEMDEERKNDDEENDITWNSLWSKNMRNSFENNQDNITDISYRRRMSSMHPDGVDSRRRDSVRTIFFGNPVACSRRFSQDLRLPEFPEEEEEIESETAKVVFFQIFIPFLIAGFGNVGAGLILDQVQHWTVFKQVSELFIVVATFLGLKGNLEMTLAARLSTQANLGRIDELPEQIQIGIGNIALVQCQSIVIAFLASLVAICVDFFKGFEFHLDEISLICATSLITASLTGFFLATIMVVVIIVSRKIGVNPDNVATLIAAFLGDITAVAMLAGAARMFYAYRHIVWLSPLVIVCFLSLLPISVYIARRNDYTRDIVGTGWIPIIIAIFISCAAGFIFDIAVSLFDKIAIFQPIINGVGSNLVAVQTSRISTYFYQRTSIGELPTDEDGRKYKVCETPFNAYLGSNPNQRTARLLLLMAIPGHIIYIVVIRIVQRDNVVITGYFVLLYLSSAAIQVAVLLYIAYVLVPLLWKRKVDPDNAAIPGACDGDGDDNNNRNLATIEEGMVAASVVKEYEKEIETPFDALKQLLIPFLIAGLGNVATGYTLVHVKDWKVFNEIPQLIILVPALLGLKGNVEMTLASRLSTHANLGDLDHPSKRRQIIIGNMALVQCQASTVGFIAPFISLALSYLNPDENDDHVLTVQEIVLLSASSVITANIANLLLGSVMCCVVVFSRKYKINPDNIATPIAASLGDFTTMILLSYIAHFLFENIHLELVPTISLAVLLLLIPLWGHIARSIRFTRQIILTGWIPIISAMLLQNTGGLIMEGALDKFKRLAAFQPVINGVGGNLVAIQSSRMSTYLHQNTNIGQLPASDSSVCVSPIHTFCSPRSHQSTMARLLLYLSAPSHLFFLVIIKVIRPTFHLTALFLVVYLSAAVTQVAVLLQLGYFLVHYTWRRGVDPDNNVIPFLTAFADLIGSGLLAIAFFVLYALGDENAFNTTINENIANVVRNATLNVTSY
ncbi:Solute carrier family 41 member 2-like protein [Leptotrombidium deliense]|uniref:Solute carrier family 41 member 2-like protein n=1 Tax=Leptotrombidium deliense TaxID=299467 RepID=A0A443SNN6_9ACAR|nr:Solute carrier family 41 member 2-like protein [Leptotrombidium deliense]